MGRRRQPIMSFQEAFNLTRGLTGSILSAKEVEKLGPDAEAVKGVGLKITAPDGTQSTGVVDPAAGGDFDAITKAYTDQGYKVEKLEAPQYAARSGSKDTGVYADENAAKMGARETNQGLKMKRADVYEKYGLEDKAKGLRAESRQDRLDMQSTQRHEQQMKLGDLQVENEQSNSDRRKRSEAFFVAANKEKPQTPEQWRDLAVKHNLPLNEQWEVLKNVSGIDTQVYEQVQGAQLRAFDTEFKASGGKLEQFLERTYNDESNPLWADGRTATIVRDKNGIRILTSEGNLAAQGANDMEVFAQLRAALKDPMTAMTLQQDIAKFHASRRESESKIGLQVAQTAAANANARESDARAGLASRTDPNAKSGGPDNLNTLTNYANSLSVDVANINKSLESMPPSKDPEITKQREALIKQRGNVMRSLAAVRTQIEQGRLGIQPAGPTELPPPTDKEKTELLTSVVREVQAGRLSPEVAEAELLKRGIPYKLEPEDMRPLKKKGLVPTPPRQASPIEDAAGDTLKHIIVT